MRILNKEKLVFARETENGLEALPSNEAKWLNVVQASFEHKDKQGKWLFVTRNKSLDKAPKKPNAVIIVATVRKNGELFLVLTKEFRIPVGDYEYGFPAGLVDENELVTTAAIREFREETGLDLSVKLVSPASLYSSAGLTDETVQFVMGTASGEVSDKYLESSEDIEVILASREKVKELVQSDLPLGAKAWSIMWMFCNNPESLSFE